MVAELDTLGRRSRLTPAPTGKRVSATARDLLWFAKLAEHGPLPTSFLLAFGQDTHTSEKRARERLADLFHETDTPEGGTYLSRPAQQFRTLDARYNQLVYDLTEAGLQALRRSGRAVGEPRAPSGPWLHRLMTSCVTASIELATLARSDVSYIPQSQILQRAAADLRCPVRITDPATGAHFEKDLIPDAVFGLTYHAPGGDRFRFFALEADRATEPVTSGSWNRKSFERSLLQYEAYVAGGAYQDHLNLTAPLLVLHVASDEVRAARMTEFVGERYPRGNAYILVQAWPDFGGAFRPPAPNPHLLESRWARARLAPFVIGQV